MPTLCDAFAHGCRRCEPVLPQVQQGLRNASNASSSVPRAVATSKGDHDLQNEYPRESSSEDTSKGSEGVSLRITRDEDVIEQLLQLCPCSVSREYVANLLENCKHDAEVGNRFFCH